MNKKPSVLQKTIMVILLFSITGGFYFMRSNKINNIKENNKKIIHTLESISLPIIDFLYNGDLTKENSHINIYSKSLNSLIDKFSEANKTLKSNSLKISPINLKLRRLYKNRTNGLQQYIYEGTIILESKKTNPLNILSSEEKDILIHFIKENDTFYFSDIIFDERITR
ncbi:hypothetical protein ACV3UL_15670 [Clostridium perfringens]